MKYNKSLLSMALATALVLASCSGLPKGNNGGGGSGGGGGGNNNGNTFLNVTVTSTPSTTFSFPSLNWQIGSLSLVTSGGTTASLGSPPFPLMDFVRLQTDSAILGHSTVAATTYSFLQVQFNAPLSSYFFNGSSSSLLGCLPSVVCLIPNTVPGFGANTVTVPITYTATANANTGIRINFDLSKAVTTSGGMTFDFTQPGAVTLSTLPPISSQTTGLDTVDNFTGVVTGVSGNQVSVSSFSSQQRTFTVASNAEFDDPFTICAAFTCLAANQNVSIDGVLNADGTMTATEIEFLDPAPATNELEGVIISPLSGNQFKMALTNGMGSTGLIVGATVTVNLNNTPQFFVDPKSLGISTAPLGFLSQTDLVLGQTVMLQAGTFSGTNTSITNPTRVLLRYSSIGGTVQTPGTIFTLGSVSPFFTNLATNSVDVQTFPNTAFDNTTGPSTSLVTGGNASVRGLYLNPNSGATQPVLATKVRTH
jgi:hypothetical protein